MINNIGLPGLLVFIVGLLGFFLSRASSAGTIKQSGTMKLTGQRATEVHYPIPYANCPNLTFSGSSEITNLEQLPTGFKAEFGTIFNSLKDHRWTATGIPDPAKDPRSFFKRLSSTERLFAIVGFLGSLASIFSLLVQVLT